MANVYIPKAFDLPEERLILAGIFMTCILAFKTYNINAAPKGGCLANPSNICVIVPLLGEIKGVLYIDTR
jgi:hypothetical protein